MYKSMQTNSCSAAQSIAYFRPKLIVLVVVFVYFVPRSPFRVFPFRLIMADLGTGLSILNVPK